MREGALLTHFDSSNRDGAHLIKLSLRLFIYLHKLSNAHYCAPNMCSHSGVHLLVHPAGLDHVHIHIHIYIYIYIYLISHILCGFILIQVVGTVGSIIYPWI